MTLPKSTPEDSKKAPLDDIQFMINNEKDKSGVRDDNLKLAKTSMLKDKLDLKRLRVLQLEDASRRNIIEDIRIRDSNEVTP